MSEHYELLYIVSIKYLEEEQRKVSAMVNDLIKEFKGEITSEVSFGKQRLSFPIKAIHQGTYVCLEFDLEAENVKPLNKRLSLTDGILRHLIIRKKIKTAEEIEREKQIQERLRREKEEELEKVQGEAKQVVKKPEVVEKVDNEEKTTKEKKESNKLSLDELDKKLDEILTDTEDILK